MARREPLNDDETRLLKIAARMPLASVANLAPVLGLDEEKVRRMLGALRRGGWVTSVVRGMTERRQHRWFLTRRAVDLLYVTDHQHPEPREEARAAGLAAFHPEGELPEDYRERFALDHDHPVYLEGRGSSPFASGESDDANGGGADHEHPPWTATSRGIETSLRRLAMLEPVYRLAPDLLRSGRVRPPAEVAATRELRMTDFRLLRYGGFYHAVARYGPDIWTHFTYAGIHTTERVLRRKEQHRFWGVDCYSHDVVKDSATCKWRRRPSGSAKSRGAAGTRPPKGFSRSGFQVKVLTLTPCSNSRRATYLPVKLKAPVTIAVSGFAAVQVPAPDCPVDFAGPPLRGRTHPLGAEPVAAGALASLGHRYLPPSLIRQLITALLHGPVLPIPQLGFAGAPEPLIFRTGPSRLQGPDRSAARNVQDVAHPQSRQAVPEGRRHAEGIIRSDPSGLQMAQLQGLLQHLQGQFRLRPVVSSLLRHPRRLAPGIVGSPTLRQVQPLVHQRPAQRADAGQEHPGLAVGHLAQPPTVLPGHSRRFPPLLGEVAAVQHPHGLGVPQPGTQVLLKTSHHRVVIPGGGREEALHGPGRDPHRLGEILGVAPVLGLYQEGPEIVPAVVPRLAAPEQRSEEGMELPKGLVHTLKSRRIHVPAPPVQAFLNWSVTLPHQLSL